MPYEAKLTPTEFNEITACWHKTHADSTTVRVPKEALGHLIMDHGRLLAMHTNEKNWTDADDKPAAVEQADLLAGAA